MTNLETILESAGEKTCDITAEALLSRLLAGDLSPDDVVVEQVGQLKRQWSTDIGEASLRSFENGTRALSLTINRDGIYDSLPQGLFHASSDKDHRSGKEMADDSVRQRRKEKKAREFFMPFETEIFLAGTQLFEHETVLEHGINSALIEGVVSGFWLVDRSIPEQYRFRLNKVIPFASIISGDIRLTEACFEYILEEKTEIRLSYNLLPDAESDGGDQTWKVGRSFLGENTICGTLDTSLMPVMVVRIGPIRNTPLKFCLESEILDQIFDIIVSFFIPSDISCRKELWFEENQTCFCADIPEKSECFLGYNSFLGR